MTKFALASVVLCVALTLAGCATDQRISPQERRIQDAADTAVAALLFEREMDSLASYHVRKDGFVVIKFHKSLATPRYDAVVKALRANPAIAGVRAEQGGAEVCPLRPGS